MEQEQQQQTAPKISGAVPEEFLCETCAFWVWGKDETQNDGSVLRFGVCIVRAPQASSQRATWPKTEAKDGCGEHEDAVVAAPKEEPTHHKAAKKDAHA